ncbi:MAG: CDP-alcohol phosphatidyltransferase family protein [Gemmatimonadetes bacterium]|jgi:CDP-diacylglycerol--glycerol-3-phosphate 3-phosphatidyltransferase|nr:CDP-alcohol phosphatidyltransferase family protein [Gemmatimonadota bacterium]MBT6144604.1 CDP-alcohol phosphatidyltransferase family protein [Gemmatimonadota bacterium]MBT7860438.1 CDP-alcohol phosphatidyltransferase family protein [Gemmatimonadota bacterium]
MPASPLILANLLSACRLLLAPAVLWSLHREGTGHTTLMLLLAGGATDLLDGYAARRLRQVSHAGKIIDPVADKVFIGAVCSGLAAWHGFPIWLLALQIVRDVVIVVIGALLLRSRGLVIGARPLGKAATAVMGFTLLTYLVPAPELLREVLIPTTGVLLVLSAARYAQQLILLLREDPTGIA